jgi:hypothetical protein
MSTRKYDQMTAAQLPNATREYDQSLPVGPDGLPGRPMNSSERRMWTKVLNKTGQRK